MHTTRRVQEAPGAGWAAQHGEAALKGSRGDAWTRPCTSHRPPPGTRHKFHKTKMPQIWHTCLCACFPPSSLQSYFRVTRSAQHIVDADSARAYYGPCAPPPAPCARPRGFNLEASHYNMTPYHRFKTNYLYKGEGWVLCGGGEAERGWCCCAMVRRGGNRGGESSHRAEAALPGFLHLYNSACCLTARLPHHASAPPADSPEEKRPPGLGLWVPLEAEAVIPVHHFKVGGLLLVGLMAGVCSIRRRRWLTDRLPLLSAAVRRCPTAVDPSLPHLPRHGRTAVCCSPSD